MTQTEEYLSSTDIDTVHLGFELLKRDTTMSLEDKVKTLRKCGLLKGEPITEEYTIKYSYYKDLSRDFRINVVKIGRLDND